VSVSVINTGRDEGNKSLDNMLTPLSSVEHDELLYINYYLLASRAHLTEDR